VHVGQAQPLVAAPKMLTKRMELSGCDLVAVKAAAAWNAPRFLTNARATAAGTNGSQGLSLFRSHCKNARLFFMRASLGIETAFNPD
jgi:hypothetical protein